MRRFQVGQTVIYKGASNHKYGVCPDIEDGDVVTVHNVNETQVYVTNSRGKSLYWTFHPGEFVAADVSIQKHFFLE